ncbi:MAG: hypothetical protein WD049_03205 [Candidatus Paceibacterota bacterium]
MALKYLLRVVRLDRDFLPTAVIASATEGTIDTDFGTGALDVQSHAALRRRFFERGLSL